MAISVPTFIYLVFNDLIEVIDIHFNKITDRIHFSCLFFASFHFKRQAKTKNPAAFSRDRI